MHRACRVGVSIRTPSLVAVVLAIAGAGCTAGQLHHPGDGGFRGDAGIVSRPDCDPNVDSDSDGIADGEEDATDVDMDGTPNDHDLDSDGDTLLDADEHGPYGPCFARDSDRDGIPDFLDVDSDNDGISDHDEATITNTSPTNADTDGDGFTDLAEVAASTDPTDPASRIPDTDFFVILPYQGAHVLRHLTFNTTLHVADVYFLVDATGSMGGPIHNVRTSLADISTQLAATISDVQFGVGYIEEFPWRQGGPFGPTFYGSASDVPYHNQQDITPDLAAVSSALQALEVADASMPSGYRAIGDGGDGPEAQVEGLYQTASGEGGLWTWNPTGATFELARRECPAIPDERGRRRGYPCFRPGSLPIIVMVTDVDFHNGSDAGTRYPYQLITPEPHMLPEAAMAINALGGRYIGVAIQSDSGMSIRDDHTSMATMTGSVDASGSALVFPAPMGSVGDRVVMAIETLALHTPMDVTTEADDWQPNPDAVDATRFIKSITAIEGFGPAAGMGYDHHDTTTFYAVVPGTTLQFDVDFWNDFRMPSTSAQIFRAKIAVIGNRSARLDERNVYIIVPPDHVEIVF